MTLHNKIGFVFVAVALFAVYGCSDDAAEYIGTWRRIPAGDSIYRGFTLGGNGIAASVNLSTTQYNTWRRKRDTLWLSGKRFTDTSVVPFTDTFLVKKITHDSLVLLSDKKKMRFARE